MAESEWISPGWSYAERVCVVTTTRSGGSSMDHYRSFNLATHVGDDALDVAENRRRLRRAIGGLPIHWLRQVHGNRVIRAGAQTVGQDREADAVWTDEPQVALAVLTADCLPVVLVDRQFRGVAIAHAGWRGLVGGVLGRTLEAFPFQDCVAWIGPGIGPGAYEVGAEVLSAVETLGSVAEGVIVRGRSASKGHLDLFKLAEQQLRHLGVEEVWCDRLCTVQAEKLYSYRQLGVTGRMASLVWLPG